jgi:hypothetical protein
MGPATVHLNDRYITVRRYDLKEDHVLDAVEWHDFDPRDWTKVTDVAGREHLSGLDRGRGDQSVAEFEAARQSVLLDEPRREIANGFGERNDLVTQSTQIAWNSRISPLDLAPWSTSITDTIDMDRSMSESTRSPAPESPRE